MTLRTPILIAAVVTALAATAPAPAAESAAQCGTHRIAVKLGAISVQSRWRISANGVSCADAVKFVKLLARKPLPSSGIYAGTYAGLRCAGGPRGASFPQSLVCSKKGSSRSIKAATT
jgi:hypothetical protein